MICTSITNQSNTKQTKKQVHEQTLEVHHEDEVAIDEVQKVPKRQSSKHEPHVVKESEGPVHSELLPQSVHDEVLDLELDETSQKFEDLKQFGFLS